MTITLNLPRELEEELSIEAARLGLPLAEYALRVLASSRTLPASGDEPLTGAELVEYWEGVIGSRRDIEDPVSFARELRERNQNRTLL
ncbi:MAG: hypothetical protein KY467_11615 [Gemmatimonadetes bacterium]|nr:hypothetical protein [Gemmatimonadota bacterium]